MRNITETINEARNVNISSLSDEELCCAFWDAWSGVEDGRSGTSSNPRATRLEQAMWDRFGWTDYMVSLWSVEFDEYLRKKLGIDSFSSSKLQVIKDAKKMQQPAHELIKLNIDNIKSNDTKYIFK